MNRSVRRLTAAVLVGLVLFGALRSAAPAGAVRRDLATAAAPTHVHVPSVAPFSGVLPSAAIAIALAFAALPQRAGVLWLPARVPSAFRRRGPPSSE